MRVTDRKVNPRNILVEERCKGEWVVTDEDVYNSHTFSFSGKNLHSSPFTKLDITY